MIIDLLVTWRENPCMLHRDYLMWNIFKSNTVCLPHESSVWLNFLRMYMHSTLFKPLSIWINDRPVAWIIIARASDSLPPTKRTVNRFWGISSVPDLARHIIPVDVRLLDKHVETPFVLRKGVPGDSKWRNGLAPLSNPTQELFDSDLNKNERTIFGVYTCWYVNTFSFRTRGFTIRFEHLYDWPNCENWVNPDWFAHTWYMYRNLDVMVLKNAHESTVHPACKVNSLSNENWPYIRSSLLAARSS